LNYILLPGRNRPEFFYLVMESLVKNPEVKDYGLLFTLASDVDQNYFDIIKTFADGLKMEIVKEPKRYGLTKGILEGLKMAFRRADEYVIVLEDDVLVSRDFLRFLDYCYRKFCGEASDIASVGTTTNRVIGKADSVYKEQWYLPWGTLIPRYFFDNFLLEHCTEVYYQNSKRYADRYYPLESMGVAVEQAGLIRRIMLKNNFYQILPEVPRSLEIGFYGKHRHLDEEVLGSFEDFSIIKKPMYGYNDRLSLEEKVSYVRSFISSTKGLRREYSEAVV
jgi:hypothetical protein